MNKSLNITFAVNNFVKQYFVAIGPSISPMIGFPYLETATRINNQVNPIGHSIRASECYTRIRITPNNPTPSHKKT